MEQAVQKFIVLLCWLFVGALEVKAQRVVFEETDTTIFRTRIIQKHFTKADFEDSTLHVTSKPDGFHLYHGDFMTAPFGYRFPYDTAIFLPKADFKTRANFRTSYFDGDANLIGSNFDSSADFKHAEFARSTDFRSVSFHDSATFDGTIFNGEAYFANAHFYSYALISSIFHSYANFNGSHFYSNAEIGNVFKSKASFRGTYFDSIVRFFFDPQHVHTTFNGIVGTNCPFFNLNWAKFNDKIIWDYCLLPDTLDFSYVTLKEVSDFEFADADSGICLINLVGTDLEKIHFDYKKFRLYFPKELGVDERQNEYERVYRHFKQGSQMSDAAAVGREMHKHRYLAGKTGFSLIYGHIINLTNRTWWGYGFDKHLILRNSAVFFMLFWFFNLLFYTKLNRQVYEIPFLWKIYHEAEAHLHKSKEINPKKFFPLFASFIYTLLIFFSLKLSFDRLQYQHKWGTAYIMFQYVMGLICLGFLVNYVVGQNSWDL